MMRWKMLKLGLQLEYWCYMSVAVLFRKINDHQHLECQIFQKYFFNEVLILDSEASLKHLCYINQ